MKLNVPIQFSKVADLYDFYVRVDFDIEFFRKETEGIDGEVLELMCGTGRVSIPLLEAGRRLVCIDYSKEMLDVFAQKITGKNYPVELVHADVAKLNLGRQFDLAFLPFHSLSEILSLELQTQAISAISNHISANGIFICTLQNPVNRLKNTDGVQREVGTFCIGEGRVLKVFSQSRYNPDEGTVTGIQTYFILDSSDNLLEERSLDICFRPVYYKQFRSMAIAAGFKIDAVYGDYSWSDFDILKSDFMIFKLRRVSG